MSKVLVRVSAELLTAGDVIDLEASDIAGSGSATVQHVSVTSAGISVRTDRGRWTFEPGQDVFVLARVFTKDGEEQ